MCWVTALPSWRAVSSFVLVPLSSSSRNTVSKWLHSSLVHIKFSFSFALVTSCLGTGYHLIVIRRSTCDVEALTERLQSHIADVKLEVSPHYAQPCYDKLNTSTVIVYFVECRVRLDLSFDFFCRATRKPFSSLSSSISNKTSTSSESMDLEFPSRQWRRFS